MLWLLEGQFQGVGAVGVAACIVESRVVGNVALFEGLCVVQRLACVDERRGCGVDGRVLLLEHGLDVSNSL